MNFAIRRATKADCKAVYTLVKELAVHENMLQQVTLSYEEFERDGFGQNPWFESLVAEVPEENTSKEGCIIVGLALYFYTYCTWKGRSVFLEDLYVMPEFRGCAIGKGLLSTVAKVAIEQQCVQMKFNVTDQDIRTRAFYAAKGAQVCSFMDNWHTQHLDAKNLRKLANEAP
ncbi:diamine acetyltransferase 1-like isoform X2 [Nerophis ophidion]|uniref:diamine acetyltransferase 1-like isoform X2 n=1 Tax=Nerophis ophidion TaxID=159077 RepID=UPI002ADF2E89|nr:diamine acetyltransferase 1-like isoform X2 [Nerophis ophidion]